MLPITMMSIRRLALPPCYRTTNVFSLTPAPDTTQ